MKKYDVIVIGSGSGAIVVDYALSQGNRVALVDKGPIGGTCLNLGCIPSKMLIYPADRVVEINQADKLGVKASLQKVEFRQIMERMRSSIEESRSHIRESFRHTSKLDFFNQKGEFVGNCLLRVGKQKIKGEKIFIVAGARPAKPPIEGLGQVEYLTNESVLELEKPPKSLIIVGGGYVAVEYAHFFAAMGTEVTILQRNLHLVPNEEPEISKLLEIKLSERMKVFTQNEVVKIGKIKQECWVEAKNKASGDKQKYQAEEVLIAVGRVSNADLLRVSKTGVETDRKGFVKVNDYYETSQKNIWAFGDVIGRAMFKHAANREAEYAWYNSQSQKKIKMDYNMVPHAVFTYPQIASVGLTERQAKKKHSVLVGQAGYFDVAKGEAMQEKDGFAKAIIRESDGQILGFHLIGPCAPILIQEVVNAMASGGGIDQIGQAMHIHPALSEVVVKAFINLK